MLKRSRFYVEEDEHLDDDIDTTETEEGSDDTEDSDDGGFESINFDASKDEYDMDEDIAYGDENVDEEDVKSSTPTTMAVDVDITTMGSDNSPVQNQYSPKEIERLNNLLSSENQAIGEYFQASKETNVDILRRLYSDIGEEERFHSEQLLFAKSQLTGEPYVPRDPDVKKEYEELLALGMDEETAMTTAVDKVGIASKTRMSSEEASQQLESVVEDMEFIQRSLYQEYVLMNIMITPEYNRERLLKTYTEAYINQTLYNVDVVMEDVVNNVENPPAKKGILRTIISIIYNIGTGIRKIFENITKWFDTVRANSKARLAWFKNHSLLDLFRSGLKLYFFDEKTQTFDFESPLKYINRITQCATSIKNKLGVEVNPSGTYHDWNEKYIDVSADIDTIDSKVDMLSKVKMIKMKVMFNNDSVRKTFIENVFCGQSDSVFNEFRKLIKSFNLTLTYVKEIAEAAEKLSENSNSIYYSNRNEYDRYVKILKTITDCCNKFISALTNDLSEMIKASKYIDNAMKNDIKQKESDNIEEDSESPTSGSNSQPKPKENNQQGDANKGSQTPTPSQPPKPQSATDTPSSKAARQSDSAVGDESAEQSTIQRIIKFGPNPKNPNDWLTYYRISLDSIIKLQSDPAAKTDKIQRKIRTLSKRMDKAAEKYRKLTGRTINEYAIFSQVSYDIIQEYLITVDEEDNDDPLFGYFS